MKFHNQYEPSPDQTILIISIFLQGIPLIFTHHDIQATFFQSFLPPYRWKPKYTISSGKVIPIGIPYRELLFPYRDFSLI